MITDDRANDNGGALYGIIRFAIAHRWLMLALTLVLVAVGIWSFTRLPIDATPDITNVQVQINTEASGYSPLESEQRVTFTIETALAGLPGLDYTRSISRYGLSQVTVVFKDGTDLHFARQQVAERIQQVKSQLPAGLEPRMGPIATGMGEIFMYTVGAKPDARKPDGTPWTATDLRTLQDWVVRPQLRNTPGVTEVNTIGGFARQIHINPRSGEAGRARFYLARCGRRRGREQPECRCRLYRTQRPVVPGARPGAGREARCDPRYRAGPPRWRADPCARCG